MSFSYLLSFVVYVLGSKMLLNMFFRFFGVRIKEEIIFSLILSMLDKLNEVCFVVN